MTAIELKEKLIAKIRNTEDEELLDQIARLIDFESNEVYEMSQGEIDAVNEGLAQLNSGQWITNEEANKRADKWLGK
jgi:predicted transcriptional regulator